MSKQPFNAALLIARPSRRAGSTPRFPKRRGRGRVKTHAGSRGTSTGAAGTGRSAGSPDGWRDGRFRRNGGFGGNGARRRVTGARRRAAVALPQWTGGLGGGGGDAGVRADASGPARQARRIRVQPELVRRCGVLRIHLNRVRNLRQYECTIDKTAWFSDGTLNACVDAGAHRSPNSACGTWEVRLRRDNARCRAGRSPAAAVRPALRRGPARHPGDSAVVAARRRLQGSANCVSLPVPAMLRTAFVDPDLARTTEPRRGHGRCGTRRSLAAYPSNGQIAFRSRCTRDVGETMPIVLNGTQGCSANPSTERSRFAAGVRGQRRRR